MDLIASVVQLHFPLTLLQVKQQYFKIRKIWENWWTPIVESHFWRRTKPEKTTYISQRHHWFPLEMTSEKPGQKLHTNDVSLTRSGLCFWLVEAISYAARPIRSTTQIWVVIRHQYGISAFVAHKWFRGKARGDVAKCRLFSQARENTMPIKNNK